VSYLVHFDFGIFGFGRSFLLSSFRIFFVACEPVRHLFGEWGIELEPSFVQVLGSVLPGPTIKINASTSLSFGNTETILSAQADFSSLVGSIPVHSPVRTAVHS